MTYYSERINERLLDIHVHVRIRIEIAEITCIHVHVHVHVRADNIAYLFRSVGKRRRQNRRRFLLIGMHSNIVFEIHTRNQYRSGNRHKLDHIEESRHQRRKGRCLRIIPRLISHSSAINRARLARRKSTEFRESLNHRCISPLMHLAARTSVHEAS